MYYGDMPKTERKMKDYNCKKCKEPAVLLGCDAEGPLFERCECGYQPNPDAEGLDFMLKAFFIIVAVISVTALIRSMIG